MESSSLQKNDTLIVLGAGNWGTTLARLYAPQIPTKLWTRTAEQAEDINKHNLNRTYLSDFSLPKELTVEQAFTSPITPDDAVLFAIPSHMIRASVSQHKDEINGRLVIGASKGFEHKTLKTMSEVLMELLPDSDIVAFSGPNIAREIAENKPTRAVIAGKRLDALSKSVALLRHKNLTFEISRDLRGVELCASLKGIIAIAVGIADGLDLGDNFTGLLMSYGLREFTTLATFMGAHENTIYGIAGLGDVVTSSLSPVGRNRRFGFLLAKGYSTQEALKEVGMVVEGVEMLKTVTKLEILNFKLPLFSTIKNIVFKDYYDHPEPFDAKKLMIDNVINYTN